MSPPEIDVLCVGYACIDINFNAPHHPGADEKVRALSMHSCGGGPASNAAITIARLGGRSAFSGYLGQDAYGQAHLYELTQAGVATVGLLRGEAPTPVAAVTIKPNGDRSIIDYRAPATIVPPDLITLKSGPPRVLLVDGHQPQLSLSLVNEARQLGIPTVLDAGSINDGTQRLYNQVDYLITSEKFARQFSGESEPRTALAALDGSAPIIAVTWGDKGVYWLDEAGQHHMPAFDIEAVDTTGAGDAFHGAFALGLAQGMQLRANLRRSCATAALTCLQIGARSALPKRSQVDKLFGAAPANYT
ncbi:PfkB family carbohydrate kinase [Coraliomargarita sp. SDUM461004]|uniref:PfkB family carbohydrate kinase n=1 Tax=Thalassobacterium sedimentorum TaxID=3041258 RepID=A0ABU1AM86_9BACT|nr:PfkB family carbohydrate kinase [Coraliomargarita sp. SDUM461004]